MLGQILTNTNWSKPNKSQLVFYHSPADRDLDSQHVVLALWHIPTAIICLCVHICNRRLRQKGLADVRLNLLLLSLMVGLGVHLPQVYLDQTVNPLTWQPPSLVYCRVYLLFKEVVYSTLPFVLLSINFETGIRLKLPTGNVTWSDGCYRGTKTILPWFIGLLETMLIFAIFMPMFSEYKNELCQPSFDDDYFQYFVAYTAILRFAVPMVLAIICTGLMVRRILSRDIVIGSHVSVDSNGQSGGRNIYDKQVAVVACVFNGFYVCLVAPHYIMFLYVCGPAHFVTEHSNYDAIVAANMAVLRCHYVFWALLPVFWVLLQRHLWKKVHHVIIRRRPGIMRIQSTFSRSSYDLVNRG